MKLPDDRHADIELGPLLRPSRVEGWNGLAGYLQMIGIDVTANALEIRRRRNVLPVRGGGVQGRPVFFTAEDIDGWVRSLTGMSQETWIRQHRTSKAPARPPRRTALGTRGAAAVLPRYGLYAIMAPYLSRGEQVLRTPCGRAYASKNPFAFEDVFCGEDPPPGHWSAVLCRSSRYASEADLRPMSRRWRKRSAERASRLIGAFWTDRSVLRWIPVPGEFFGLTGSTTTPFLASRALPRFGEAISWIRSTVDNPVFVAWSRRVEVRPVTLEEVPGAGLPDVSHLLT